MFFLKISESNMLRRSGSRGFHGQCPIRFFCTTGITTPYLLIPHHTIMYTITNIPYQTTPYHTTLHYHAILYHAIPNQKQYHTILCCIQPNPEVLLLRHRVNSADPASHLLITTVTSSSSSHGEPKFSFLTFRQNLF